MCRVCAKLPVNLWFLPSDPVSPVGMLCANTSVGGLQLRQRMRPVIGLALMVALFMAACSGGSSSGGSTADSSTTPKATATVPPTAKPKPTAIPATTVALCEGWLSISEANQILSPPKAIATVFVTNDTNISTCQYQIAGPDIPLLITFENFTPGTQMSQVAQQASAKDFAGATINVNQAVSGVGDQA
jgi:hypothetical protein